VTVEVVQSEKSVDSARFAKNRDALLAKGSSQQVVKHTGAWGASGPGALLASLSLGNESSAAVAR